MYQIVQVHWLCLNLELVQHVMVDGGYTGNDFADQVKLILNAKTTVAKRNELHTFTVLPQRWIVERSWSWLDKCRRLWKNCERALRTCLVSAESGRIVENRLRSLSCQIIQAIFLERNLR